MYLVVLENGIMYGLFIEFLVGILSFFGNRYEKVGDFAVFVANFKQVFSLLMVSFSISKMSNAFS